MGTTSVWWESKIIFEGVHQDNELKIFIFSPFMRFTNGYLLFTIDTCSSLLWHEQYFLIFWKIIKNSTNLIQD